jgi:co-chaperonin GroES (HSP10)
VETATEILLPPAEDICGIMQPAGFKILIFIPPKAPTFQKDGKVVMTDQRRDLEETASVVAQVVALGSLAYKDEKKFPDGPWCQPGDFVIMRQYSGTRFQRDGYPYEYRLINDDTVEGVLRCDPAEIKRAY